VAAGFGATATCEALELVQEGDQWEWRPKKVSQSNNVLLDTTAGEPVIATPVNVLDTPGITIKEYFGNVASKDGTVSFAQATVHRADEAGWQAPRFAEYVLVHSGVLELLTLHEDGAQVTRTRVQKGSGAYLPAGLRVKWSWPGPCSYTVVCLPAYSPHTAGDSASSTTVVDGTSRASLAQMHQAAGPASAPRYLPPTVADEQAAGITPLVVSPVDVVDAPGITITEHFGNVASSDPLLSLGQAVVKGPSQEAWQAPAFDEFVICTKGSIEFLYGNGRSQKIVAGQGVFLPMDLRVKWVWPEATNYVVLCLPAFTPSLCGREAEENATNAKDSASMARLQKLHQTA